MDNREVPAIVDAFENAQRATTVAGWLECIASAPLSWEMLPDAALAEPDVWAALIEKGMPQTALMRQLPRLTKLGLLGRMSATGRLVAEQLADAKRLRKARVHPVNVLVAARTYSSGQSARGQGEWQPVAAITDALDAAFYAAFGAVEPAGKRTMLALDVSGSMSFTPISGMPITPREASAALTLVTAATEPAHQIMAFSHELVPLSISPGCTVPAQVSLSVYTTNVSTSTRLRSAYSIGSEQSVRPNGSPGHCADRVVETLPPHQALRDYRHKTGIDARLAVVGMTATDFTIADPDDPGMLDVAGFDSAVPTLLGDFSRRAI